MTDQELLELAAKAAGLQGLMYFDATSAGGKGLRSDELSWDNWNPLEDDDDALRLAVNLKLSILLRPYRVEILGWPEATPDPLGFPNTTLPKVFSMEAYADDPYAATRRAIVRAAAEIGRAM